MADGDDRQATFGSDGSLETETTPDATGENDFGEEKEPNETDGGYSRYVVSSLLQKAVRRSDEEVAAWAAWELARSGYAWNLWDRLNLYVVEDLRAGDEVALTIERYEALATERWEPDAWKGRLCAIHAALAAARARSTREASNADAYFGAVAEIRADARERGEEPAHDFPVGDLEPEGEFDAVFDGHTGEGSKRGRGTRFFKTHGARVGPEGEDEQSARWQRLAMLLDEDVEYDADELDRAVEPVDPDDPWTDLGSDTDGSSASDATGSGASDGDDDDDDGDTSDNRGDDDGSLSDFAE
ncbi:hypothetical protein [Halorubrum sp. AS12]|uniref:hypothetical protein n=1 Tax=Halorubrum sp. AS12 TaxID=3409687 RepID=UPI003DA6DEF6